MASESRSYVPSWLVGLFVAAMVVSVFASAYFGFEVGRSNPKLIYQTVTSRDFTVVTVPSLVLYTQTVTAPAIVVTTTTTVTTGQYWSQVLGQTGTLEIVVSWSGSGPLVAYVTDLRGGTAQSVYLYAYSSAGVFRGQVQLPLNQIYEIRVLGFRRTVWLSQLWQQEVFP